MDNTTKSESIAADLRLLAGPFRFILAAVKVLLFTLSFPLLCGLMMLSYAVPGIDPLQRYTEFVHAHSIPLVAYPFVILGALVVLAVDMLLVVARDLGGLADILLRVPLLGTVLFALASTFWLVVVRGVYRRRDGQENLGGWSSLFLGFTVAFTAGLYVSGYPNSLPPATLLWFANLPPFNPPPFYLFYLGPKFLPQRS